MLPLNNGTNPSQLLEVSQLLGPRPKARHSGSTEANMSDLKHIKHPLVGIPNEFAEDLCRLCPSFHQFSTWISHDLRMKLSPMDESLAELLLR